MNWRPPCCLVALSLLDGCALYWDVNVTPLICDPANIERGGDLPSMLRKSDFNHAISLASDIAEDFPAGACVSNS